MTHLFLREKTEMPFSALFPQEMPFRPPFLARKCRSMPNRGMRPVLAAFRLKTPPSTPLNAPGAR
jgi:hypothetical protein